MFGRKMEVTVKDVDPATPPDDPGLGPKAQMQLAERREARAEERAWRERLRAEDADVRQRTERNARLYSALAAAAESAGPGASPDDVIARANHFLSWLKTRAGEP
jgi:hypothetical protein